MDCSRLLEVLNDIETECGNGYVKQLQAIVQAYTSAQTNPTQDMTVQIQSAFEHLSEFLESSLFNNYPPSKQNILNGIEGANLFGHRVSIRSEQILMA